jgi:short-subunit dehydrogenase
LSDDTAGVNLISDAGTDTGYRLARELLQSGRRVVVTSRHTTALTRILHGCNAGQVLAFAADLSSADQFDAVLTRSETRLGKVSLVIDGRTGRVDQRRPNSFHPTEL